MKILVIFTGGTIGCKAKKGFLSTDESTTYALLDKFDSRWDEIEFVTASPYSVLSENLSACEINMLQKEVADNLKRDYDGIVITHGTDTLVYAASALEYAVGGCDIPVVLVSSDYPLDDERTNGYTNFEGAVEFIKSKKGKGVFVSYKNAFEKDVNIHIATHLLAHCECTADLYSVTEKPYAVYACGEIMCNFQEVDTECNSLGVVEYKDCSDILVIESHPGDNFSYSLDNIKAVILKPYHSATLNTACSKFQAFCMKAKEKGIPVFLVNAREGITYESTSLFSKLNICVLPFSTYISAYMKIWAAISRGENITEFCKKPVARELLK